MLHGLAVARLYRSRIRTANIQLALQPACCRPTNLPDT